MTYNLKLDENQRQIVIGSNSQIWKSLSNSELKGNPEFQAISHSEVASFDFNPQDNVWILSYSRNPKENESLFLQLAVTRLANIFYITTATTNVLEVTRCYEYPRIKGLAQNASTLILEAHIVSIGVFYEEESCLPPGLTAATSAKELASFMKRPFFNFNGEPILLFRLVSRSFNRKFEKVVYLLYGMALRACGPFPCLLRPLDFFLRLLGVRWYGYLYLSNKLWSTTT